MGFIAGEIRFDGVRPAAKALEQCIAGIADSKDGVTVAGSRQGDGLVACAARGLQGSAAVVADPDTGIMVAADATFYQAVTPARPRANSVAEEVLQAYLAWGTDCPDRVDGDFSFVIWDAGRQRVFAATDPAGVRPLYFAFVPGVHFSFASDAWKLAQMIGQDTRIPESRLVEQLVNPLEVLENWSPLVSGTRWLEAGHSIVVESRKLTTRKYWTPGARAPGLAREDASGWIDGLRSHFEEAVRKRVAQSRRPGVLLSGGLDSSSVLGVAAGLPRAAAIDTFSLIDSASLCCPETRAINVMNAAVSTRPHLIDSASAEADAEQVRPYLWQSPRYLAGRGALVHLSFARARQLGVDSVMDGLDADALFSHGGMGAWAAEGRWRELRGNARKFKRLSNGFPHPYMTMPRAIASLTIPSSLRGALTLLRARKGLQDNLHASLLAKDAIDKWHIRARYGDFLGLMHDYRKNIANRPQRSGMDNPVVLDGIRRMGARAAQHGLQLMHPFLDRELMDFCAWIPPFLLMKNGRTKWAMRKAMNRYLPHEIAWRADKTHIGTRFDRVVLQPVFERFVRDLPLGNAAVSGYVDHARVLALAERWKAGGVADVAQLNEILLLEYWLQHNQDKVLWGS